MRKDSYRDGLEQRRLHGARRRNPGQRTVVRLLRRRQHRRNRRNGGNIIIDNINNPQTIRVNGPDRVFREEIKVPRQITGYEYQFIACRDAIAGGLPEPPQMPLEETLYIMQIMDGLRSEWGVRYPMDGIDYSNPAAL